MNNLFMIYFYQYSFYSIRARRNIASYLF